ncbi:hypothetical protein AX16_005506 [Volvariella volvacea WC 439]|nr:hypothetical protein AX16_005506 [Volvariella volvacea WC 439]
MDELLHHCLRELAFDGDLGSNVIRLKDFIDGFYSHNVQQQNIDDAFCAFVWSMVVEQPNVQVGTVPQGVTSEVFIAPQVSAKRKAKAKGEEPVESIPPKLNIISDAKQRPLESLKAEYGDNLRIALSPNAIYTAITGSHIRFAKLSPMVYSALQLITRGRDNGLSVVALGQQSGYDQKTCFYLVRQLTELGLVVKVRRGGVGTHFCIHKYFFERSPSWQAIRDEELQAKEDAQTIPAPEPNELEDENTITTQPLDFTPIDARHLSSLPLVRARVIKLLKASKSHIHASQNMIVTIGFANPTKTDRRFFQSRIREMIQQGLVEKVIVPSNKKTGSAIKCLRLVEAEGSADMDREDNIIVQPELDDDAEQEEIEKGHDGVKLNLTIHKQIVDLLHESGTKGMTLTDISTALCQFDRRTIELLLTRAEKFPPPPHLSDLGIVALMETSGRERRHRYFTVSGYRSLVSKENLHNENVDFAQVDSIAAGGFMLVNEGAMYDNEIALLRHQDSFKLPVETSTKAGRKATKTEIPAKRGRPRKYPVNEDGMVVLGNGKLRRITYKRKSEVFDEDIGQIPSKKRRVEQDESEVVKADTPPRKRGRPKKVVFEVPESTGQSEKPSTQTPRRTGRSTRKAKEPVIEGEEDVYEEGVTAELPEPRSTTRKGPSAKRKAADAEIGVSTPVPADMFPQRKRTAAAKRSRNLEPPGTPPSTVQEHETVPEVAQADRVGEQAGISAELIPEAAVQGVVIDPALISGSASNASQPQIPIEPDPIMKVLDPALKDMASDQPPKVVPRSETPMQLVAPGDLPTMSTTGSSAPKQTDRGKVNVSHLRRENELYKVIENHGGIINIQTKEIYEAHSALIEKLAQAGEPTSAPVGTKTDKRTIAGTFNSLERRGKVKQLRTSVTTYTGVQKPACIVYLPTISQEQLNEFLAELSRTGGQQPQPALPPDYVKIDEPVEFGANTASSSISANPVAQPNEPLHPERWSRDASRAEQIFSNEDAKIREILLGERTTLAQLYSFIVGRMARARALYLAVLEAFEKAVPSLHIVSHEERILDTAFLSSDITLQTYCKVVSTLVYDQEVLDYLRSQEGSQTLVRDIPQKYQDLLQVNRARPRTRVLDNLELLKALKLITPLQISTSVNPFIQVQESPSLAFDIAPADHLTSTAASAIPTYWQFNKIAPIYLYGLPTPSPPFHKNMEINTVQDAINYWETIKGVSTRAHVPLNVDGNRIIASDYQNINTSVLKTMRRQSSWSDEYVLTWHQTQYLNRFASLPVGDTPLQIEDENERRQTIERLAWVISAPQSSIQAHYEHLRNELKKETTRAVKIARRNKEEKRERLVAETKASLARKAAEAKAEREREWEELITRVHPAPLKGSVAVRIKRVRARFLQAGTTKDKEKWENEIQGAIHEAAVAAHNLLRNTSNRGLALAVPPPAVSNPPEKSIQELIAEQGPALPPQRCPLTFRAATPEPGAKAQRRSRTFWSRDFEELARDASVIIRARCRNLPRLDWGALEQVFPAIPRNSVRQRLGHIRESPGNDAYLKRLEDKWYELWVQHRGTPLLPDDDPQSPTNFDLIKHIEFLRRHVDKNAIRVGFVQPREKSAITIPDSVESLHKAFTVIETHATAPTWDFVWNATVEEGREKRMLIHPFLNNVEDPPRSNETLVESICVAESALKMVFGTSNDRYDADAASSMLHDVGEGPVSAATKNLLARGVVSKIVRDPSKPKPGRQLKISEANQNALGGTVSRDLFTDAVALEEIAIQQEGWREWPLLATDGDIAALVELVSDHKVEFKVDTTQAQLARPALEWNSKKADDDDIETSIHVRYHGLPVNQTGEEPIGHTIAQTPSPNLDATTGHGETEDRSSACCRRLTEEGLVDCAACLKQESEICLSTFGESQRRLAEQLLDHLRQARSDGLSKPRMKELGLDLGQEEIQIVVGQMTDRTIPLCSWVGYEAVVLVSTSFLKPWTVVVSENPMIKILPRRWIDITGSKIVDVWEGALRAIMGIIIFHPGITQGEVRWRLRAIYDRQEVNDLLHYLQEEDFLKARSTCGGIPASLRSPYHPLYVPSDEEEQAIFWSVNTARRWYQV